MMLEICPMTLKEANAYVEQHHRHHRPVVGHKFSIGCGGNSAVYGRDKERLLYAVCGSVEGGTGDGL